MGLGVTGATLTLDSIKLVGQWNSFPLSDGAAVIPYSRGAAAGFGSWYLLPIFATDIRYRYSLPITGQSLVD
ncbi:hypothetical protein PROH_15385 [Prochlorothrix hollandica PCC 9006 = CALU 1027]|uniref:Uncharacterized protein n=1 Tax=Prochlorothrix hollandica PCC 9006 = CALU 1027 TaxID=317619 RepID=A0A0M2PXP1_PROHO|nr:hypothetical protein PROH_15385 [Prochlorothrix hollandica PCC 9006 = CALU 1027]